MLVDPLFTYSGKRVKTKQVFFALFAAMQKRGQLERLSENRASHSQTYSPRLRFAGRPSLHLRRKEGENKKIFIFNSICPLLKSIKDLCRELRKRETEAEKILWEHLRNRNYKYKFLRQYPICALSAFGKSVYYIPDFYCHQGKLVIEADGPIHLYKKEYDKNRDDVLKSFDLTILRFTNDEIITDAESVINQIITHLENK